MRKRMTRQQIKEGLEQVPIEQVLLGHNRAAHKVALTAKQLKFADALARGDTKAGAYRKAYDTKAKPQVQSIEGQKLSRHPAVSMQVEAIRLALEAEKYATPLHLRALIIQRLTEKALDPDVNHAQQLRALELLGKVTEIAAFTERRETVHVHDAQTLRDKLMHSLRMVADAQTVDYQDADSLLAELGDQATEAPGETLTPLESLPGETPPAPDPQDPERAGGNTTYSIPHPRSTDCNNVTVEECNNVTQDESNNVTECNDVTEDCNNVTDDGETVTRVTVVAKTPHSDCNNVTGGGGVELLEAKDK